MTQWIKEAWATLNRLGEEIDNRNLFLLAGGIAFNQLLCLLPLVLLIVTVTSSIIGEETTKEAVRQLMRNTFPESVATDKALSSIIQEITVVFRFNNWAGWIAGVSLLWTASTLFSSMRTALNDIFGIKTPKLFVLYRLKDMLLTIIVAVLVLLTTLISPLLGVAQQYAQGFIHPDVQWFVNELSVRVVSICATTIMFGVLYRFVPNKRMPWIIVLRSTVIAVLGWEGARIVFTYYVSNATSLSTFYGGYLATASVALWLYYAAMVYLLAAEISQFIHKSNQQKIEQKK